MRSSLVEDDVVPVECDPPAAEADTGVVTRSRQPGKSTLLPGSGFEDLPLPGPAVPAAPPDEDTRHG